MTSMLYRPAMAILDGQIDIDEAVRRMRENGLDNALEHDQWYGQTAGLRRVAHDRRDIPETSLLSIEYFKCRA